jgi:gentisate 1,2-dioxygenase
MVWLDGLDIPLVRAFNGTFREDHDEWVKPDKPFGGLIHFPYARAREVLESLATKGAPDAHLGHVMRYSDPQTGGWAMPTIAAMIRLLPAGFATQAYRSSDGMVFACVEGSGRIQVGEESFEMSPHDIAVVPGWMPYTLHASRDWILFSYSDRAAQERLGFWREQRL